jgi:protein-S-isoprenylcysteine O-methyltransferase Ste14
VAAGVSDEEASVVDDSDEEGEATAMSVALGVAVAWALPPGVTTTSKPAATMTATKITLTAIAGALRFVQMRSMRALSHSITGLSRSITSPNLLE